MNLVGVKTPLCVCTILIVNVVVYQLEIRMIKYQYICNAIMTTLCLLTTRMLIDFKFIPQKGIEKKGTQYSFKSLDISRGSSYSINSARHLSLHLLDPHWLSARESGGLCYYGDKIMERYMNISHWS